MFKLSDDLRQKRDLVQTCLRGYAAFKESGQTPVAAYHAFRQLYVQTNGMFNDIFQYFYGRKNPTNPTVPLQRSLFKNLKASDIKGAVQHLDRDGYYVFPQLVPSEVVDELMRFSLKTPATTQSQYEAAEEPDAMFVPDNISSTNYRFLAKDVINNFAAQALMADPALLSIAQQYFRSQAMYCNVHMWWTTPFGCSEPSSSLAQLFHFDMDRIKFLNFFIYLTDVDTNSGPHCYVRTSHRRKPQAFLQDRRFQDAEIAQHYRKDDVVEINGPKGTLIAVDGRGFHKAKMPTAGNRLIFLSSMSSSLFGQTYPREPLEVKEANLKDAISLDPRLCSAYDVSYQNSEKRIRTLAAIP